MSRYKHIAAVDLTRTEKPLTHPAYRRYYHSSFLQKLRTADTQTLISDSCASMRDFCDNVQSITIELNRLLNSIETILPLINACLAQSRETITLPQENITKISSAPAASVSNVSAQGKIKEPASIATQAQSKQPKPEDIQQLLENPLIKNILNNFMQNIAPNKPN